MSSRSNISISSPAAGSFISRLITRIRKYIGRLFEPEEVEVTFRVDGKHVTYTYTKVEEKQVA